MSNLSVNQITDSNGRATAKFTLTKQENPKP